MFPKTPEYHNRNTTKVLIANTKILGMLGVSLISTDHTGNIRGARFITKGPESASWAHKDLRLYAVHNPNLGTYSPTRVIAENNAERIVRIIMNQQFNPRRDIVLNQQVSNTLKPVIKSKMSFNRGVRVHIEANSLGKSILLLPLQFSNCMKLEPGDGHSSLHRANLIQTAILFDQVLDTEIFLDLRLFSAECRMQDISQLEAMQLKPVETEERYLPGMHPFRHPNISCPGLKHGCTHDPYSKGNPSKFVYGHEDSI